MEQVDFLIVGQGLAGTCLAYELQQRGASFMVADANHLGAASTKAAGSFHPMIFKRLTTKWKADEMMRETQSFFAQMEQNLGIDFVEKFPLLKIFHSDQDGSVWQEAADAGLDRFIDRELAAPNLLPALDMPFGGGWVREAGRLKLEVLLPAFRAWLRKEDRLIDDTFSPQTIEDSEPGQPFVWKGKAFKKAVFCEGYQAKDNRLFDWLPLRPAKGEYLIIKIPGAGFYHSVNRGVLIIPMGEERFWVGSTYDWDRLDETPTASGSEQLAKKLSKVLQVPYEVEFHRAGVRPTTKDRRPLLGTHPEDARWCMFNGLGTRGVLIAPYLAKQMAQHVLHGTKLEEEISIIRYWETTT